MQLYSPITNSIRFHGVHGYELVFKFSNEKSVYRGDSSSLSTTFKLLDLKKTFYRLVINFDKETWTISAKDNFSFTQEIYEKPLKDT